MELLNCWTVCDCSTWLTFSGLKTCEFSFGVCVFVRGFRVVEFESI